MSQSNIHFIRYQEPTPSPLPEYYEYLPENFTVPTPTYLGQLLERNTYLDIFGQLLFYGIIVLVTVIGNLLVIATVYFTKSLHNVSMYLIASLSFSDMMVGLLVMPIKVASQFTDDWLLPQSVCLFWTSTDIFFCTASIINLCMIGLDRFWTISGKLSYIHAGSSRNTHLMLAGTYGCGAVISLPSLFFNILESRSESLVCAISQNIVYTVFSTVGAFYLPLVVLCVIYMKIYRAAKTRWARSLNNKPSIPRVVGVHRKGESEAGEKTAEERKEEHSTDDSRKRMSIPLRRDRRRPVMIDPNAATKVCVQLAERRREKIAQKEIRALKTVFIILSSFIICWLPFFVMAALLPFCGGACEPPRLVRLAIDWLGYANSGINPIIYAAFNVDFRKSMFQLFRKERRQSVSSLRL